ncbi:MAG: MarC family protein, partial [Nanoarchaeota archaeon]
MIYEFFHVAFSIFIVMDTLGNLPIFHSFVKGWPVSKRSTLIRETMYVAGAILLIFLFFGERVLTFFTLDFESFKIAGGIIVLIIGIKQVLGLRMLEERAK